MLFSWRYVFRPREAQWWVGIVFSLVGIGLIVLLPMLLTGVDAQSAIWAVRLLGGVFLLIGAIVLALTILRFPDYLVHTIGGAIGALAFGIPSTFVLPGLLLAHRYRPNFFFRADETFDTESWIIGSIFTLLGLLTTIGTFFLARYQLRHETLGWSWSWSNDDDEK